LTTALAPLRILLALEADFHEADEVDRRQNHFLWTVKSFLINMWALLRLLITNDWTLKGWYLLFWGAPDVEVYGGYKGLQSLMWGINQGNLYNEEEPEKRTFLDLLKFNRFHLFNLPKDSEDANGHWNVCRNEQSRHSVYI
jgi:hypothetical protein